MSARTLILIAPGALFLGAAVQIFLANLRSAKTKGILALLFCLPALAAAVASVPAVHSGQAIDFTLLRWDGPFTLAFHVDALSALFALMGAGIGGFVLLYSIGYMAHDRAATRFYATMLVFIGAFLALVYSANLFVFYLCWEVVGLCSFSLVGFWYTNPEAVRGARKVLLMTHIAGYGLLAAILVLYLRTGSALWTDPGLSHAFSTGIFLLMLVALVAKSVQFPLHTWIPEAMAAPTPVSALLHAACYVKAGVYLAARMHSFGVWPVSWSASLIWVGTATMAIGVMYAMVQTDLKRMLAFSTVSQIGYMMLGIGIGTPLAITAGLLHCLNHGFFKGGLFLTAGSVQHAAGTRDMNQLGGLAQRMPRTTLSWFIGVGSMMGFPLMSGFASKWMLYAAALQAGWVVPAVIAWSVSLGTVFLGAKATSAVFLGPVTENTRDAHESPASMVWGMGFLAAGSILLGIAPQLAVNTLLNPVLAALSLGAGVHVTWLGLSADAGSFSTVGGLVLAVVSLVLGGAIYAIAYVARPVPAPAGSAAALAGGGAIFTGGEPISDQERLTAADFSRIFLQNWHTFFRWTNVDRAYLAVWEALLSASRRLASAVGWLEQRAIACVFALTATLLIALRWFTPAPTVSFQEATTHVAPLLAVACLFAALALVISVATQRVWRHHAILLAATALTAIAALFTASADLRLSLLELASVLSAILVWRATASQAVRLTYASVVALSAASFVLSHILLGFHELAWSRALLLTGICLKLAAVPFLFWLLRLADELPAVILGTIIAVIDMAAFGECATLAAQSPQLFAPQGVLLAIAALTSLIGALLMLSQSSLKRLLVLSTVEDAGFLLFGLASANTLGLHGALFAAATHSLGKALLFLCLSAPEAAGDLRTNAKGLVTRYPYSTFGFLFGMLAMLGIPPTLGFAGRWRLYSAALSLSPSLLALFIAASILALVGYTLALTRIWWGEPEALSPSSASQAQQNHESLVLRILIVGLVVLLLLAGLWPDALRFLPGGLV